MECLWSRCCSGRHDGDRIPALAATPSGTPDSVLVALLLQRTFVMFLLLQIKHYSLVLSHLSLHLKIGGQQAGAPQKVTIWILQLYQSVQTRVTLAMHVVWYQQGLCVMCRAA